MKAAVGGEVVFSLKGLADHSSYSKDTINVKVDTSALSNIKTNDVFELEALETARNDKGASEDDGE
mgnify:CR=1 FL=1